MTAERMLEISLAPEMLRLFYPYFQQGVEVEVEVGGTIKQLLTREFGISSEYQAARITTLFLNSKAVDDASKAIVEDGAVLALSGAMPGLVGATMRSGGYYAAMRGAMTYRTGDADNVSKRGVIKLKLFNLLLDELGPRLLLKGIELTGHQLKEFFTQLPKELRLRDLWLDGQATQVEQLTGDEGLIADGERYKLKVTFGDTGL